LTARKAVAKHQPMPQFKRRPLRLDRLFVSPPLYFVTFCTHSRAKRLASDAVHAALVEFGKRAERDHGIAIGRYVIMPDHIHLFVRGGFDFVLGRWVGLLKQVLAKASGHSKSRGQTWQEGFFDHVLRNDESYQQKWIYVRDNPVRARLAESSDDWPYQGEIIYIDRA
jgi:putative transposase